jgi:hypothetical protein
MLKFKDRLRSVFPSTPWGIILGILACLLISGYSIGITSAGKFPAFPDSGKHNYYIDLSQAFLHGQLSMLKKPSAQLMTLKNPYSYFQRINVPYQFDYSYYKGKYYLYWGPVPGLVLAGIVGLTHIQPSNAFLALLSYIGLTFLLLIVLIQIRKQFFPTTPGLSTIIFIVSGLVNLPILFLLGRTEIYETSIIAGQFFLILGLAAWMLYMGTHKPFWILIAGLSWGLAIGSRYNLAISILLFIFFATIQFSQESKWKRIWNKLFLLITPLALCVLGLGIYNYARFGNPLETGLSYQLTQPIQHFYLLSYIPSNLYAYFFSPLNMISKFPFIKIPPFTVNQLPFWLQASVVSTGKQYDSVMTGLFPSTPMIGLLSLIIPLALILRKSYFKNPFTMSARLAFFLMILAGGFAQLLYLLVFFYGAVRYIADFYLLFTLIIAMLVWRLDELLRSKPALRFCFWMIVIGLSIWTAVIGYFGGFSIPPQIFRNFNPALYSHLAAYWNNSYEQLRTIYNMFGISKVLHFILHIGV